MKQVIHTDQAPAAVGAYSQAIKVGDTVYISGQLGIDSKTGELKDGFKAQAYQVFDNLDAIAKEAGGSLKDVVKFNVSVTDLADFATLNAVFEERLVAPYPARAAVQVAALPKGGVVEIEAILVTQ